MARTGAEQNFPPNFPPMSTQRYEYQWVKTQGRITLNVLLSFAQFEREVTGERIRDKIAASKRKGMWMGGVVLELTRFCRRCWGERKEEVPNAKNPSTIRTGVPAANHRAGALGAPDCAIGP